MAKPFVRADYTAPMNQVLKNFRHLEIVDDVQELMRLGKGSQSLRLVPVSMLNYYQVRESGNDSANVLSKRTSMLSVGLTTALEAYLDPETMNLNVHVGNHRLAAVKEALDQFGENAILPVMCTTHDANEANKTGNISNMGKTAAPADVIRACVAAGGDPAIVLKQMGATQAQDRAIKLFMAFVYNTSIDPMAFGSYSAMAQTIEAMNATLKQYETDNIGNTIAKHMPAMVQAWGDLINSLAEQEYAKIPAKIRAKSEKSGKAADLGAIDLVAAWAKICKDMQISQDGEIIFSETLVDGAIVIEKPNKPKPLSLLSLMQSVKENNPDLARRLAFVLANFTETDKDQFPNLFGYVVSGLVTANPQLVSDLENSRLAYEASITEADAKAKAEAEAKKADKTTAATEKATKKALIANLAKLTPEQLAKMLDGVTV